jgi:hypothetical protein
VGWDMGKRRRGFYVQRLEVLFVTSKTKQNRAGLYGETPLSSLSKPENLPWGAEDGEIPNCADLYELFSNLCAFVKLRFVYVILCLLILDLGVHPVMRCGILRRCSFNVAGLYLSYRWMGSLAVITHSATDKID